MYRNRCVMFFSHSFETVEQCSNQLCNTGIQKYLNCFKLHFMLTAISFFITVLFWCLLSAWVIHYLQKFSLFFLNFFLIIIIFFFKVFATEVNSHRDQIIELDKTGTHLKYFSQKQDVVLIKNLLISVQSRWEKVVQRLVERGRALDDARKRAKQVIVVQLFELSWNYIQTLEVYGALKHFQLCLG